MSIENDGTVEFETTPLMPPRLHVEIDGEEPADTNEVESETEVVTENEAEDSAAEEELELMSQEQLADLLGLIDSLCEAREEIEVAKQELAELNEELTKVKQKATEKNDKILSLEESKLEFLELICEYRDLAPSVVGRVRDESTSPGPSGPSGQKNPIPDAGDPDGWRKEYLNVALSFGSIPKFGAKKREALKAHGLITVGDLEDWRCRASSSATTLHALFQEAKLGIGRDSVEIMEDRQADFITKWKMDFDRNADSTGQVVLPAGTEHWLTKEELKSITEPSTTEPDKIEPQESPVTPNRDARPGPARDPKLSKVDDMALAKKEAIEILVLHFEGSTPKRLLKNSQPWDYGNIAASRGQDMETCPYDPSSEEFVDWIAGYVNEQRNRWIKPPSDPEKVAPLIPPSLETPPEARKASNVDDVDLGFDPLSL